MESQPWRQVIQSSWDISVDTCRKGGDMSVSLFTYLFIPSFFLVCFSASSEYWYWVCWLNLYFRSSENKFLTMLSHFYDEALIAPNTDFSSTFEVYALVSSPPRALGGTVSTHSLTVFINLCSEVARIPSLLWCHTFISVNLFLESCDLSRLGLNLCIFFGRRFLVDGWCLMHKWMDAWEEKGHSELVSLQET